MLRPVMNCELPTYPKPPDWAHKITLFIAYDINLELIRKFPRKLIQCVQRGHRRIRQRGGLAPSLLPFKQGLGLYRVCRHQYSAALVA